jgi:tripartite-type tricarboxylate transporter receptor subunit TctC
MRTLCMAIALVTLQGVGHVSAQGYPSRPITMVVPAIAGGSTDAIARIASQHMQATLGQPVVVENVAGAGGTLATARVLRAAADGYTLSIGTMNSHVAADAVYPVKFNTLKDLEPIALLTNAPIWIVAANRLPAKSMTELIAWLKANPGKTTAAIVGTGTASHLCGVHFQNNTGTRFLFVPYRSGPPAYSDLVAGHVDFMCAESSATLQYVRGQQIKAYAVMSKTRWTGAPDVPTVDEVGLPGLHISFWQGLWTPRGTPKDVIARLNSAVVSVFSDSAVTQRLMEMGLEIPPRDLMTPQGLGAFHRAEVEKWWPIVKAANIKAE